MGTVIRVGRNQRDRKVYVGAKIARRLSAASLDMAERYEPVERIGGGAMLLYYVPELPGARRGP